MLKDHLVGVDGCKAGWIAISVEADHWHMPELFDSLAALWQVHGGARRLLIDMPVGLPDGAEERRCEQLARRLLGPRRSSVYRVPCREAVYAHGDDILRINRQRTGKGLSVQCLRIIPRIRQVDLFLRSHPEAVGVVSESHPELVFFMLNGGVPLRWNKKSAEGRDERTRIILGTGILTHEELDGMLSHRLVLPRPRPGVDDVLDALVLAVAAQRRSGCMRSLPDEPVCDEMGLPMQMVY